MSSTDTSEIHVSLLTSATFLPPGDDFRVSWRVRTESEKLQDGFEIQTSSTDDFSEGVGSVRSDTAEQSYVVSGALLGPRERLFIRVRVDTEGRWSEWSDSISVEGALGPRDWRAVGITLPSDPGRLEQAPSPLLRRSFLVDEPARSARLHVTSLGVNHVAINGEPVTDELLNPGWTSYHKRLLSATYDVTDLITEGENVIAASLGDGWYRGRLGWGPGDTRGRYGRDLALVGQLEITTVSGRRVDVVSDETWKASTGAIRRADLYDGCTIDLRDEQLGWDRPGFGDLEWVPVELVDIDMAVVRHRSAEPVRVIDTWHVELEAGPDGSYLLDGGQNISGYVRLLVEGSAGDEIVVKHAEVLNPDGSLHTRALRSAEATDRYVLATDGQTELEPKFTFHGFRYATVESAAKVRGAQFVAISSDLGRRGHFRCSDPDLNSLHENVVWSLRDNFVAIPTDCPQRDERLGWTGDAQAFASTSVTLVNALPFWKSWLEDLSLDQHPDLGPPAVVPDVALDGPMRYGRAGWADAATIVPWALYESYGDLDVLRRQFTSMQSWVDSLKRRTTSDGLLPESPQFGDWLDPDAPGDKPWEAKVDPTFVANAFFAASAAIITDAARLLHHPEAAVQEYRELTATIRSATWARWSTDIELTQSGCAIALHSGVVPIAARKQVARSLADLVRSAGGRVATGFLGTPLVLPALAGEGLYDEAYLMLLCRDMPSWLYQVDHGATTTWERWDAIMPDGSIHPGDMSPPPGTTEGGHMLSFNHYAYGAVIDWVYRHLGGIAPDPTDPGYRTVVLRPRPPTAVEWAETSIQTDLGRVALRWSVKNDVFDATIEIPFGMRGVFDGPVDARSEQLINGVRLDGVAQLTSGIHQIRISSPDLAVAIGIL